MLRKAKIDMRKQGLIIYDDFVLFCEKTDSSEFKETNDQMHQIAKEILNEKLIIKYRSPFLNGLKFDAFFQKYQIALEMQGAQHWLHSTSWYKDVKKLKDIINRDQQK
ncbi:19257_t:CDS:2 [Funneliformis geosporum]|nr:19257_t:CDS:2 [Funneliformis geosporum]